MKLSCKVVEDILPIYYDGICSVESATLVEEHLKECPLCSRLLAELHGEIEISEERMDDLKPLEKIRKRWKRSKRLYIGRGILITLTALLLVVSILAGIWYLSYGKHWYRLTKVMERTTGEEAVLASSDYVLEKNGYRFDVCLPVVLSNSGFVRVMDDDGLVLFLYPETGGRYSFWLYITNQGNESYSVHLKADMSPDFENYPFPVRSESEKQKIRQTLTDQRDDVAAMFEEIYGLWGIDLLEFAS